VEPARRQRARPLLLRRAAWIHADGGDRRRNGCPAPDILVNNAGGPPIGDFRDWDLGLSNGARAGLTGFVAGLARQAARHNVAINNLLPGPFLTHRQVDGLTKLAAKAGQDYDTFLAARVAENPAGRFGTSEEFGKACAFLCSAGAGFIIGQNLVIDGGSVNVTI
jgi:3-oxoacyl-[acyl-carrier protein] reductase